MIALVMPIQCFVLCSLWVPMCSCQMPPALMYSCITPKRPPEINQNFEPTAFHKRIIHAPWTKPCTSPFFRRNLQDYTTIQYVGRNIWEQHAKAMPLKPTTETLILGDSNLSREMEQFCWVLCISTQHLFSHLSLSSYPLYFCVWRSSKMYKE